MDESDEIDDMPFVVKGAAGRRGVSKRQTPSVQINNKSKERQQLEPLPYDSSKPGSVMSNGERNPITGMSKLSQDQNGRAH